LFTGQLISGVGVVGLIVNLILYAPIQKRTGLKGSILLGGVTSALCFLALGFPVNKWWWFAFVQLFVFGENIMGTSIQTIITLVVHPSQFGKAMGMMTFFMNIARAGGPFIFAPIYEHVSHTFPWFLNSLLKVAAFSLCLLVSTSPSTAAGAESPADSAVPSRDLVRALSSQCNRGFLPPGVGNLVTGSRHSDLKANLLQPSQLLRDPRAIRRSATNGPWGYKEQLDDVEANSSRGGAEANGSRGGAGPPPACRPAEQPVGPGAAVA